MKNVTGGMDRDAIFFLPMRIENIAQAQIEYTTIAKALLNDFMLVAGHNNHFFDSGALQGQQNGFNNAPITDRNQAFRNLLAVRIEADAAAGGDDEGAVNEIVPHNMLFYSVNAFFISM